MESALIFPQVQQRAKLLVEVSSQLLMFKQLHLKITACFRMSGTVVVSSSRKVPVAPFPHLRCTTFRTLPVVASDQSLVGCFFFLRGVYVFL